MAAVPYAASSIGCDVGAPETGVSHLGALLAWTTFPLASLSWNFAGIVLPALNTLICEPLVWAVSLIGCSQKAVPVFTAYRTEYVPVTVVTFPARSFAVAE